MSLEDGGQGKEREEDDYDLGNTHCGHRKVETRNLLFIEAYLVVLSIS